MRSQPANGHALANTTARHTLNGRSPASPSQRAGERTPQSHTVAIRLQCTPCPLVHCTVTQQFTRTLHRQLTCDRGAHPHVHTSTRGHPPPGPCMNGGNRFQPQFEYLHRSRGLNPAFSTAAACTVYPITYRIAPDVLLLIIACAVGDNRRPCFGSPHASAAAASLAPACAKSAIVQ